MRLHTSYSWYPWFYLSPFEIRRLIGWKLQIFFTAMPVGVHVLARATVSLPLPVFQSLLASPAWFAAEVSSNADDWWRSTYALRRYRCRRSAKWQLRRWTAPNTHALHRPRDTTERSPAVDCALHDINKFICSRSKIPLKGLLLSSDSMWSGQQNYIELAEDFKIQRVNSMSGNISFSERVANRRKLPQDGVDKNECASKRAS